jgi:hypothetical protein
VPPLPSLDRRDPGCRCPRRCEPGTGEINYPGQRSSGIARTCAVGSPPKGRVIVRASA